MAFSSNIWIAPPPNYIRNTKLSKNQEWVLPGLNNPKVFVQERIKELARRHKALQLEQPTKTKTKLDLSHINFHGALEPDYLVASSYDRCRELFLMRNHLFSFGSLTGLDPQKYKALWAIWAWGLKLDDLVDGANGSYATHEILDQVEERVIEAFQGRPHDIYDIALADAVSRYPVDIQLFRDEIDGTRMDIANKRIKSFEERYLYRYFASVEPFLVLFQIIGTAPESTVSLERIYDGIVTFGLGLGFADTLTDITEDAQMGRIYYSREELQLAGVLEEDIFKGRITDNWRNFMREQVQQARVLIDEGTWVINELNKDIRWEIWTGILVYKKILDNIEAYIQLRLLLKDSQGRKSKNDWSFGSGLCQISGILDHDLLLFSLVKQVATLNN